MGMWLLEMRPCRHALKEIYVTVDDLSTRQVYSLRSFYQGGFISASRPCLGNVIASPQDIGRRERERHPQDPGDGGRESEG